MFIEPSMDLDKLADLMYRDGAPYFDGTYGDSEFWETVVDFRDRLVDAALENGWEETQDVSEEEWNKLLMQG
jgi:Golgi nucleoside diphosphatase